MDLDIFKTDQEKSEARRFLPELTEHPGWKFITKALDANIKFLSLTLREKKDFSSLEELYALQDRISDFEQFKDLPQTIVAAAQEEPTEEEEPEIY